VTEQVYLTIAQYEALEKAQADRRSRGLCAEFHPPTGDICTRPMDHDGPHRSGVEWGA
jgi:hypothetical protein